MRGALAPPCGCLQYRQVQGDLRCRLLLPAHSAADWPFKNDKGDSFARAERVDAARCVSPVNDNPTSPLFTGVNSHEVHLFKRGAGQRETCDAVSGRFARWCVIDSVSLQSFHTSSLALNLTSWFNHLPVVIKSAFSKVPI